MMRTFLNKLAGLVIAATSIAVISIPMQTSTASAASFSVPTIDCVDSSVRVDPNVSASYGQTDGYYRIYLFKMVNGQWRYVRYAEGRVSWNQSTFPTPTFANVGGGRFAAMVEQWDQRSNGTWAQRPTTIARQAHWMSPGYTSETSCWL